ncbi:hypothetical protein KDL01_33655, partial [Actinospica durhamensis]
PVAPPPPRPPRSPRQRTLHAVFTACVVGMLGLGAFGISNTLQRASRDHVAVTGYDAAQSCTADGTDWQPPTVWCKVTDVSADATGVVSPLVSITATVDGDDPVVSSGLLSFYADFGTTASVPDQIQKVTPLTVITHGGSYNVASVTIGTQVYQTTNSPLVQYTTDTESFIAAIAWTAFAFVWTVRRLIRGRGPARLRWISLALLCATAVGAFVAAMFDANRGAGTTVGTSITPDWLTSTLLALAAGAVMCVVMRHPLFGRDPGH